MSMLPGGVLKLAFLVLRTSKVGAADISACEVTTNESAISKVAIKNVRLLKAHSNKSPPNGKKTP
ncbi:hypothetical protein AS19_08990 [Alcanivorax sp. NBRC 101098]|nr:hypothetical protein AS19_08990 [Alcanivorax sp. NBRC 101098]